MEGRETRDSANGKAKYGRRTCRAAETELTQRSKLSRVSSGVNPRARLLPPPHFTRRAIPYLRREASRRPVNSHSHPATLYFALSVSRFHPSPPSSSSFSLADRRSRSRDDKRFHAIAQGRRVNATLRQPRRRLSRRNSQGRDFRAFVFTFTRRSAGPPVRWGTESSAKFHDASSRYFVHFSFDTDFGSETRSGKFYIRIQNSGPSMIQISVI